MESLRQQLNERESAMAATRQELEGCQAVSIPAHPVDAGAAAGFPLGPADCAWVVHQMLRKAEAEVEGCRAALAAAGARHMEQLAKERADAAVALRQAKANSLRQALRSTPGACSVDRTLPSNSQVADACWSLVWPIADASPRTERALQSILEWLEDKQMHREGASAGPGRLELTKGVFERMKSMLLESEQRRSSAETDSRIASGEVLALRARLCALEVSREPFCSCAELPLVLALTPPDMQGALERRTCEWEAVEVARASAERLALRHAEQRLQHFEQQKSLLGRRIQSLEDALQVWGPRLLVLLRVSLQIDYDAIRPLAFAFESRTPRQSKHGPRSPGSPQSPRPSRSVQNRQLEARRSRQFLLMTLHLAL